MTLVLSNTFKLDFAVCSRDLLAIQLRDHLDHIIELNNINISEDTFKSIFYQTDNFAINPNAYLNPQILPLISFGTQTLVGTTNGDRLCLIDEIYKNIENDMGVNRLAFSANTNISLNKQINSIKTLCDLKQGDIVCSLKWSDIVNTISSEFANATPVNKRPKVILTLSVVFTSPTVGVHPTIIRFNYCTNVSI